MRTDLIIIKGNKVEFTDEDIKAAMEESKRKVAGNTISRESFDRVFYRVLNESIAEGNQLEQYNEGVRAVLAAVIGLGSVGLLYNIDAINRELQKRPESPSQKVQAIQQIDQQINSDEFHRVAAGVIDKITKEPQAADTDKSQPKAADKTPPAKSTQKDPKPAEPVSAEPQADDEVIGRLAATYILPSEIYGNNIHSRTNNKFMRPYRDDVGKWTVGVGHLIGNGSDADKKAFLKDRAKKGLPSTMTRREALSLFDHDISERVPRVRKKFATQWPSLSNQLKAALVDIEYRGDLLKKGDGEFKWVELLKQGEYDKAAEIYLQHKEYRKRSNKNPKGDGVVKRMNRNSSAIAAEDDPATSAPSSRSKK